MKNTSKKQTKEVEIIKASELDLNLKEFANAGIEVKLNQKDIIELIANAKFDYIMNKLEEFKSKTNAAYEKYHMFIESMKKDFVDQVKRDFNIDITVEDLKYSSTKSIKKPCFIITRHVNSTVEVLYNFGYGYSFKELTKEIPVHTIRYNKTSEKSVNGINQSLVQNISVEVEEFITDSTIINELDKEYQALKKEGSEIYDEIRSIVGGDSPTLMFSKTKIATQMRVVLNQALVSSIDSGKFKKMIETKFKVVL